MNEAPTSLDKFIKSTVIVLSLLGVLFAGGAYFFYQKGIVEKAAYSEVTDDIDSVSDSEMLSKTLESIPKIDPEDTLTQEEVRDILKNNQIVYAEDESLAEADKILIIKNNTTIESPEN